MRFDRALGQGRRDTEKLAEGVGTGSRIEPDGTQAAGSRSPAIGEACSVL
jgi:hypothetical protein